MRLLAIDPGAKRAGYAVLEHGPKYVDSGILSVERGDKEYQAYKLELIEYWTFQAQHLFEDYSPEFVVSEIVPAVGGGNFVVATQSQLAQCVATVIQALAYDAGIGVSQLSAGHVKRQIGGIKDASKVKVRNGVLSFFPELEGRRKELTNPSDESDAIGIGLCALGYHV